MTFSELCAEVYKLTARPDLVAETESAVKSATLKCHQSDYFYKDIFECTIQFTSSEYVQNLDYRALLPRWRALKYLRKLDILTGTPNTELDIVSPVEVFDSYKIQKSDVCYVAGAFVQINSRTKEQYYILGCYLNPDITSTGYTSWVALDHPYAIVYDAASTLFKAIGKDEEASAYRGLVNEQINMIRMSNVVAEGY